MREIEIRPVEPEEYPLLEDFLYDAIYLPEGVMTPPREIINRPELAVYITDFGQPDDITAEQKVQSCKEFRLFFYAISEKNRLHTFLGQDKMKVYKKTDSHEKRRRMKT